MFYGMRVIEPHHDGCPHGHYLIFTKRHEQKRFQDIFEMYSLADAPDDKAAKAHRIKFEKCDYSKGSPASYMAKYVSKNINGYGLTTDDAGDPIESSVEKTVAWARTFRIRQFQFFGIPSRTIWRELRKPKESFLDPDLEELRKSAFLGDFKKYMELSERLSTEQKSRPIQIVRLAQSLNPNTGEIRACPSPDAKLSYLFFQNQYFQTQSEPWIKSSPPDLSTQLERTYAPSGAECVGVRLRRNQTAPLGLVSITVQKEESKYLLPNRNQESERIL